MLVITDELTGRIVAAGSNGPSLAKSWANRDQEPLHKPAPRPVALLIHKPKPAPRKVLMKSQPTTRNPSAFDALVRDLRTVQARRRINGL